MKEHEERLVELEVKLAYAEQRVVELDLVCAEQDKRLEELTAELRVVRGALQRLAANTGGGGEVLGAYDADDPVPSSG